MSVRLTPEEKGTRVADELFATDRANIDQLARGTDMSRASVAVGVRWLRDTFGDEALVCDADHYYQFAMTNSAVVDYRYRRLSFIANSLERLQRVLEAGEVKFGANADEAIAVEMVRLAVRMLRRGMGGTTASPALERV
ncbi:MAG TPA: hypothetical protein VIV12_12430 [Streptosporangiaceae bacterium]